VNACTVRRKLAELFVRWSRLGRLRDSKVDHGRRKAAKKVFEKLWVAGTLGAFFTGFYQTIARDFHPHALNRLFSTNALDHLIRYLYFLWLFVYFFVSNFRNEREDNPPVKDLVFDVVQSTSALSAVVFLGFIGPNAGKQGFGPRDYVPALIAANVGIAAICLSSLAIFGCDEGERPYNAIRLSGLGLAVFVILAACFIPDRTFALWMALEQLVALWVLLVSFLRLSLPDATATPTPTPRRVWFSMFD
jgi:hypothetical protein